MFEMWHDLSKTIESHVKETGITEAKHDINHEPIGLNGIHWVEGCSKVGELVYESCDESVKLGHHIAINGKAIPFSKFEEVYDSWQLTDPYRLRKCSKSEKISIPPTSKRVGLISRKERMLRDNWTMRC